MKKALSVIFLLCIAFLFTACSPDNEKPKSPVGTYTMTAGTNGGTPIDLSILEAAAGKSTINITSDEKITMIILGQEYSGTWTLEGTVLKITIDDSIREYSFEGDSIIMQLSAEVSYTFTRNL